MYGYRENSNDITLYIGNGMVDVFKKYILPGGIQ